jgi:hypothetical protein
MQVHAPLTMLVILAAFALSGCGVEASKPAPVIDQDKWGHLPPDPDSPQQAEAGAGEPQS